MDSPDEHMGLLTTQGLARRLNISVATVHRMRRSREIPVVKIRNGTFRYDLSEVLAELRCRTEAP